MYYINYTIDQYCNNDQARKNFVSVSSSTWPIISSETFFRRKVKDPGLDNAVILPRHGLFHSFLSRFSLNESNKVGLPLLSFKEERNANLQHSKNMKKLISNADVSNERTSTLKIPSRSKQVQNLKFYGSKKQSPHYDILVIGAGATGAGISLDAVTRENANFKVACIERGDFANETSSRSTKLLWAGIKYLGTASAALISFDLVKSPFKTLNKFKDEFRMVVHCHQERRFMLEKQAHLCHWMPIAIPFNSWIATPAPFNHPLFSLFPILSPLVFKFYDALSSFSCPSSYILSSSKALEIFPQLSSEKLKYVQVFYEAMHNDARTNVAIALTAAEYGAHIANYVEMQQVLYDNDDNPNKATGVIAHDHVTNESFPIYAKKIIFAGGPFTDLLRKKECSNDQNENEKAFKPAVKAAAGSHIVLPGKYVPSNMGLLDYNTSDGRFLFYLPWENHTLVGTTDVKCPAQSEHDPPVEEIDWLLNECTTYLNKDVKAELSNRDVISSAWRGWRPLANDPHAPPGAPISRDHIISENPDSGIIFIAGGKWVTWRGMSQDVMDKVVKQFHIEAKCKTKDVILLGGRAGYSPTLSNDLHETYSKLSKNTVDYLVRTYGGQAWQVCKYLKDSTEDEQKLLAPSYPYTAAEVIYACREEYACTVKDVLCQRTRLAFLNKQAAVNAIPLIAYTMKNELGWSKQEMNEQIYSALTYINTFGGDNISPKFISRSTKLSESHHPPMSEKYNETRGKRRMWQQ